MEKIYEDLYEKVLIKRKIFGKVLITEILKKAVFSPIKTFRAIVDDLFLLLIFKDLFAEFDVKTSILSEEENSELMVATLSQNNVTISTMFKEKLFSSFAPIDGFDFEEYKQELNLFREQMKEQTTTLDRYIQASLAKDDVIN